MAIGQALRARGLCLTLLVLLTAAAGCFGGDDADDKKGDPGKPRITVWSLEFQPDRLRATKANIAAFTRKTHIGVDLVPIGDDELPSRMADARSTHNLPDVAQLPLDSLHTYARENLLDTTAPQDVLDRLGDETFEQTALSLASRESRIAGVPSDGWGQLLIYRKDLFDKAGLRAPTTLQAIERAARRLDRPGWPASRFRTRPTRTSRPRSSSTSRSPPAASSSTAAVASHSTRLVAARRSGSTSRWPATAPGAASAPPRATRRATPTSRGARR